MGILDTINSAIGGGKVEGQNDLMSTIMNLVGGQQGGLDGLISEFKSKGLGDVISSWVGTGNNLPISSDQIQNILGSDQVKNIASKLGIDANSVTSQLSNLLPQVIDKLTPDGKVPEGDLMSKGMDLFDGLFGKK
ncbi:MAG: YidB family protein [Ignavibacteriaceae bacterium]